MFKSKRAQLPPRRWGQRIIPLSKITLWADRFVWGLLASAAAYFVAQVIAAIAAGRIPLHGGAL